MSDNTGIARRLLTTAVRYWAAYPGEVDAEIAAAEAAEEAAEQAWLRERLLLAGRSMSQPLLLDEMFTDDIAQQLRTKGDDVHLGRHRSGPGGLPDDQILAYATAEGRALVTANIKDFIPLDARYRAADQSHAGLILVSTKTFPQNRGFPSAVAAALATLLSGTAKIQSGQVLFLTRG